jgi:CCR4-NOT transcription complex subunit 1
MSRGSETITERQVADALLYMLFAQNGQAYTPSLFVTALTQNASTRSVKWPLVVRSFDRKGVNIDAEKFIVLFEALLPLSDSLDMQFLWGGQWENLDAQFSFLRAFLSVPSSRLDLSKIPDFRRAFDASLFEDASEATKEAAQAQQSPFASSDAVSTVLDLILNSNDTWTAPEVQAFIHTVLLPNLGIFTCSAFSFSNLWTPFQEKKIQQFFSMFFLKQHDGYQLALHGIWKKDQQWVMNTMFAMFQQQPNVSINALDHALEHGWLDTLLKFTNIFTLDLASLAHQRGNLDLEAWIKQADQKQVDMATLITAFLRAKAEDEISVQRKDQLEHRSTTLAIKTVYVLLEVLEDYVSRREHLQQIQRLCIQAYPRLVNYGEGFDDIIEANGTESNAIPEAIDKQMQDLFGQMYHEELSFREILEKMRQYKTSKDPAEQDLFTCMVHGLLDEYHCYPDYPLEALTKTAVMFGGVINFRLVSGVPLKVGLGMIMDAVREYRPEESMYKFGVEALEQLIGRLQEWQGFCSLLLQTPSLRGTDVYKRAEEVLRDRRNQTDEDGDANGLNGMGDGFPLTNGNIDDLLSPDTTTQNFKCLHVDPPLFPDLYEDPDEQVQDKVLFVLNNVSVQNIETKLKDLKEVLEARHHQWFANYLVEQRAKSQPNFQQLYLDVLTKIGNKILWTEVLRETYVSAIRLLNSESTMNSSQERAYLGNLGVWLGSLTIAKDKPIKHKNIYFRDLLIEGYDTQRLIMVIPFTCKVLLQASKSSVFKLPNPWLMDILALLSELYHSADLKLNLKFEIEVLCGDLGTNVEKVEPSTILRDRQHISDDLQGPTMPDNMEPFDELSLGLNRSVRNERFSPAAIIASIPDLESKLVYPPSSNGLVDARLRQIVQTAVQRAIAEIISPVVERSVTIASISTAQLILKDFAMEPDEERVRESAETMVKSLAGSLALVTCKEPLRMSITNSIRVLQQEFPDHPLPEGSILMCVNDNLDTACEAVEKAAEEQAIPEINRHIKDQLEARRRHRTINPDEPFIDPVIHRWAFFIPEPYRQATGGLNTAQRAIYEEFNRHPRGPSTSHVQSASMDSNRQLADILQEPFPIPNLSTPAEPPALPHQTPQQQELRMQPPPLSTPANPAQINGYMDSAHPREKIQNLLHQIQVAAADADVEHIKDVPRTSSIWHDSEYLINYVGSSEELAHVTAQNLSGMLYEQNETQLGVEITVNLLFKICHLSPLVAKEIVSWLANQEADHIFNVPVTMALLEVGLIELNKVDYTIAKALSQRKPVALTFLSEIMDCVLFNQEPVALRADFALSLDALNLWNAEDSDLTVAKEILQKLKESGIPDVVNPAWTDRDRMKLDQMRYIFEEWLGLFKNPSTPSRIYAAFIKEMHQKQVMNTQEDSALFFRLCLDECVAVFEHEEFNGTGNSDDMFMPTDGLAKLIILLVKLQGESNGAVKASKSAYLNSIMSLLVLVLNNHHIVRGEQFNQRVFFRLFSGILCEYYDNSLNTSEQNQEMMFIFAEKFLVLQPFYVPGFVFGWLGLVAHRALLTGLLNMPDEAVSTLFSNLNVAANVVQGWELYCQLMQAMLSYVGELLKPANTTPVTMDLYRGVLRILLVLHHDFPEFVAENHFRLCNVIPAHCAQLRNLILSAYPSSFQDLPDPFAAGLKVDRLEEIRKAPRISGDYLTALQQSSLKVILDNALRSPSIADVVIRQVVDAVSTPDGKETAVLMEPLKVDVPLLNAVVLYIGQQAVSAVTQKGGPAFTSTSPHANLLVKLAREFNPEARYYFLSAIANQLRYPNSHTHYFSYAILHLFGADHNDQQESDIRQQITRVLLERLNVHRPHPWGLIITLLELLKNPTYMFWELPFIKAAPEVVFSLIPLDLLQ